MHAHIRIDTRSAGREAKRTDSLEGGHYVVAKQIENIRDSVFAYDARRGGRAVAFGDLRQKMIDSSNDARKRMEAVLTSKQLDKLRAYRAQDDQWSW